MPTRPEEGGRAPEEVAGRGLPTSVFLRPLGTPMPLGMVGLTVATVMLAGLDLSWVPSRDQHEVAICLILFDVPLQATAMVFGFLARDPVVGTGFGVQAATWLTVGVLLLVSPPGSRSPVLALLLFVAAGALISSVVVAGHAKLIPGLVMLGTVVRWVLTGLYEKFGSTTVAHASGWEGIALAVLALYTAVASDLESARHATILPLGRLGAGRRAITGSAEEQVDGVINEPGVRSQL